MAESAPSRAELPELDLGHVAYEDETGDPWRRHVGEVIVYAGSDLNLLACERTRDGHSPSDDFWLGDKSGVEDGGFDDAADPRVWHRFDRLDCFVWSIRYGYADRTPKGEPGITYVALPETYEQPPQWRRPHKKSQKGLWVPVLLRAKRVRDGVHDQAAVVVDMTIEHSGRGPLKYSGLSPEFDYGPLLAELRYPLDVSALELWLLAHDVRLRCDGKDRVFVRWSTHGGVAVIVDESADSIERALNGESSWVSACRLPPQLQHAIADVGRRWLVIE